MTEPIGIIGGSGLYHMPGLRTIGKLDIDTPFGKPSAPLMQGSIFEAPVVFLARHGEGHRLTPTEIPYRANLWALKEVGVRMLISVSAVGSLQELHQPGQLRLVRQYIDKTKFRQDTFFGDGLVAHVAFAEPVCPCLTDRLLESGRRLQLPIADGTTYVCMEGPAFSTKAESLLHRSWGADLIGMTQVTEAKLARELEICFATVAMVTDYDAWREEEASVDAAAVIAVLKENVHMAQRLIAATVESLKTHKPTCRCQTALKNALMTALDMVPNETRSRLQPLISKYGY